MRLRSLPSSRLAFRAATDRRGRSRRNARRRLAWLIPIALSLGTAGCREDAAYPQRPIILICPWAAGGGTDEVSRQVARLLEADLGVPVNVVNATGGSGVTGHTRGALADPDGYTVTMMTVELNMLHWRGLTNIGPDDFEPVMLLNRDNAALFVRADAPWETLEALLETIRSEPPGTLSASGTAQGGIWHVSLAGWLVEEGLGAGDVRWTPINGAGPSLNELMARGVEMVCCSLPEAVSLLEAGQIRCLGVMADERDPSFPDVPTFKEQGSDWSMGGWRGLGLPLGVPDERVETLVAAVERVVNGSEFRDYMAQRGFNVSVAGPAEFRDLLETVDTQMETIFQSEAFQSVRTTSVGPMVFPAIIGGVILLVVGALLVRSGLGTMGEAASFSKTGLLRMGAAVAFVLLYLVISPTVGYMITAAVLLGALLAFLTSNWRVALLLPLVLVPLTYQIFAVWLRVPLPWGWLGW